MAGCACLGVLALLLVRAAPAVGAERMWVGFQDDWGFRWGQERAALLDDAAKAGATIVRTTVYWSKVAPTRPANAADPFDPAYRLSDLDELVRGAQRRGLETLLTIWGTPRWANGGAGENRVPRRLSDLRVFAQALAARYSGRYPGYPFVRFYSVWNEPNLGQFLSPQFSPAGQSLAPALYAGLFRSASAGIRAGNPSALVAAGETAPRGLDGPTRGGFQASHSPARFAEELARVRPRIRPDAWAHHPYPLDPRRPPAGQGAWPAVSIPQVSQFRAAVAGWFARPGLPLWITEFGYQTTPGARAGVPPAAQGRYLAWAFAAAHADPNVRMFIWFVLRDRSNVAWKGGLQTEGGRPKSGLPLFARAARAVDVRNPVIAVRTEHADPVVSTPATRLGWYDDPGAAVGITYSVFRAGRLVAAGQVRTALRRDGTISFRAAFWPIPGFRYVLFIRAQDIHGNTVSSRAELVPLGHGGPPPWRAGGDCRGVGPVTDAFARHCP